MGCRFIRWDVQPLEEVKRNLERGMLSTSPFSSDSDAKAKVKVDKDSVVKDYINDALNLIPLFNKGFYKHPSINYGVKYSPSSSSA